jgi:Mn2+/Fe2+ NRAMP family transporter
MVFGPGLIVMEADNHAGAVATSMHSVFGSESLQQVLRAITRTHVRQNGECAEANY